VTPDYYFMRNSQNPSGSDKTKRDRARPCDVPSASTGDAMIAKKASNRREGFIEH